MLGFPGWESVVSESYKLAIWIVVLSVIGFVINVGE
jgi:hypothetical protein